MDRPVPGSDQGGGLASGTRVGPYAILEPLGAGGMGVVYKAQDTRLQRLVALKFLPADVSRDPQALARFRREAQVASSLSHPHICTIYDIGEDAGRFFIAMELMEGQTLDARIGGRPLPLDLLLGWALQITDALDAAHKRGVVHRDLKPSNIFVTSRGDVKLLDFGLAKHVGPDIAADAATISASLTVEGQIVGTVAYMSPEQVQGGDVDLRSDIFAFGAVLYEMATGRRAFSGNSPADLIADILRGTPGGAGQKPALPAALTHIIDKALEKDRADRYQSAGDLTIDLRRLKRESSAVQTMAQPPGAVRLRMSTPWTWLLAAAVVLLLGILIAIVSVPPPVSSPLNFEQVTFSSDLKEGPIVTDGTRLYFQSQGQPVEMSINGGTAAPLRASVAGLKMLDVSPDASEMLALKLDVNDETGRGSLWTIPMLGGSPRLLGSQTARSAHWSPDGRSVAYTDLHALFVSDRDGGHVRKIWEAPSDVYDPYFSPDSRVIRLTAVGGNAESPKIWEVGVDGGSPHRLAMDWPEEADQENGQWTPDGKRFIFVSRRDGLGNVYELLPPRWFEFWKRPTAARLTAGQVDVRAITLRRDSSGMWIVGQIARGAMHAFDPNQKRFVPFLDGLAASVFVVSPDRQWMAYADFPRHHLWRSRLDGRDNLQLTNFYSSMPQWSPDSRQIAFSDWQQIYVVSVDGGVPEKLIPHPQTDVFPSWWPDGKSIAFNDYPRPGQPKGIKVLDLATRRITTMPGTEEFYMPSWSPDGRHMVAAAQNPSRLVLYSKETGLWKDLKTFESPSGIWVWANDSRSVYVAIADEGPGIKPGFYRLDIADGAWTQISGFDGLTVSHSGIDRFPSLTADGRPALMSDTSVVQIYSTTWK